MEKIIEGHLVGFGSLRDMEALEEDYNGEFTDAGMTEIWDKTYDEMPSEEEAGRAGWKTY